MMSLGRILENAKSVEDILWAVGLHLEQAGHEEASKAILDERYANGLTYDGELVSVVNAHEEGFGEGQEDGREAAREGLYTVLVNLQRKVPCVESIKQADAVTRGALLIELGDAIDVEVKAYS